MSKPVYVLVRETFSHKETEIVGVFKNGKEAELVANNIVAQEFFTAGLMISHVQWERMNEWQRESHGVKAREAVRMVCSKGVFPFRVETWDKR